MQNENEKILDEGNQIHNFMCSSSSGTVNNYGSGSDFLTSYGSISGSGLTSQKVTVPTVPVPVPQHCLYGCTDPVPAHPGPTGQMSAFYSNVGTLLKSRPNKNH